MVLSTSAVWFYSCQKTQPNSDDLTFEQAASSKKIDLSSMEKPVYDICLKMMSDYKSGNLNEGQIYERVFKNEKMQIDFAKVMIANNTAYEQLGFEKFMAQKLNEGVFSQKYVDFFYGIKSELDKVTKLGDVIKLQEFWQEQSDKVKSNPLFSIKEQNILATSCLAGKISAKLNYEVRKDMNYNKGCNLWEAVGCGTLATAVAVAAGFTAGVINFVTWGAICEFIAECRVTVNGQNAGGNEEYLFVTTAVVGVISWSAFYNWCCNGFSLTPTREYNPCTCPYPLKNFCHNGFKYDGCNCSKEIWAPAGTHPFVWGSGYYHTPVAGKNCGNVGVFDGANCWVGDVPTGAKAWVLGGGFYHSLMCR